MSCRKLIIAGLPMLAFAGVCLFLGLRYMSEYKRFGSRSTAYYSQIAELCEAVLHQHPRPFLGLSPDPEWKGWFRLPHSAVLPPGLRGLRPDVVRVSSNAAYFGFSRTARASWGIVWVQRDDQTNCSALELVGPGERVLCVKNTK